MRIFPSRHHLTADSGKLLISRSRLYLRLCVPRHVWWPPSRDVLHVTNFCVTAGTELRAFERRLLGSVTSGIAANRPNAAAQYGQAAHRRRGGERKPRALRKITIDVFDT
jgi:hypothetical protein